MGPLDHTYILSVIGIMTAATFFDRSLAFFTLKKVANHKVTLFVGKMLPPMIMMLLLIYSYADIDFSKNPFGLNDLIATAVAAALYIFLNNALLSIGVGTGLYMVLKQTAILAF